MFKKIIYMFVLVFFTVSCGDSLDSVKRGLTGSKKTSADEFLIKKKDPLIMPPNYKNLPSPEDRATATDEISTFKKTLGSSIEDTSSKSSSAEQSILKQIQSK